MLSDTERAHQKNEDKVRRLHEQRTEKLLAGFDTLTTLDGPGGIAKAERLTEKAVYVSDCWADLRKTMVGAEAKAHNAKLVSEEDAE